MTQSCSAERADRTFWLMQIAQTFRHYAQKTWWMVLGLWLVAAVPAQARLLLRVAIEQDVSQVKIGSSTDAALLDASGQATEAIPAMNAVVAEAKQGQIAINHLRSPQFCLQPSEGGFVFIGEKWYRGSTCLIITGNNLTAVNYVDLEQYLYSVVGAEMPTHWSLEALKAQAVAARSYVLYQRQNSATAIFDVGSTTRWQVYGGVEEETASTRAAVESTRDQVLIHNGRIINAVFHACAGGYTENVEDVWSSPLPYLRAVPSPDANITECQWTQSFSAQELSQKLNYPGTISAVIPSFDNRGRIASLRLEGSTGSTTLRGTEVRRALGVRSTLFTLQPLRSRVAAAGDLPAAPSSFQLIGRGNGHGIGMSQWGAKVFADQGYNYAQILAHYYTGASLATIEVE
ncbi:SpoIID/LytB domain-containing protein [Thermocoleostomius sinensis]|uniref:SpoIID/LytB domain-containing protein n=1 Tax=Thermocoleostomius sinensis A174 TaxID=2016057 RepID=A0A9E8ZFW7_9CYAN|nr:SpoIID/LytB domain-containing protein [Thermocoleostomius sinensis]WAL62665.1 SpoIID/LytB domain-containing protein [Thermocoleostomius sinensis A174]